MKKLLFGLIAFLFSVSNAMACFHFPANYRGKLTEGLQEAFLYHDGENAHMVIRTNLSADKFPKEIAWVLPFPSLPSRYEEIKGRFFEELFGLFPSELANSSGHKGRGESFGQVGDKPAKIKVHEKVDVGSYQIQPIEILKEDSNGDTSDELSQWLKKNKFNPMPKQIQKPYLKKGATFLAIRMQMDNPGGGDLRSKSLHIVYRADRLSMPIKFTHEQRTYDLNLYVFSSKEIKNELKEYYLRRAESVAYKNEGLLPFVDDVIGKRSGFITLYKAEGLNSKKKKLARLKDDPSFLASDL